MKKKFWTSDKIVGLVALMISLITLVIFVKQTNIMEKQSRLSAMPYLLLSQSYAGVENKFSLELVNHGVGPAIIDSTVIIYKGKVHHKEFYEFLTSELKAMDSIPVLNYATLEKGSAIPAGGERNVLTVGGSKQAFEAFLVLFEELQENGLDFEIRYRSIYDDQWRITSETDLPEKLND
ncbi:MAG: hypothetical protein AB3N18_15555 [Allomuricauda sp.]